MLPGLIDAPFESPPPTVQKNTMFDLHYISKAYEYRAFYSVLHMLSVSEGDEL